MTDVLMPRVSDPEAFIARPSTMPDRMIRAGLMLANLTLLTLLGLAVF